MALFCSFFVLESYSIVEEGNGTPLQYSCLENPMDGGAWWAAVHGVAKSQHDWAASLSLSFHALEKEMAPHSSALAWRVPGTGSLVGCVSGHDWTTSAAAAVFHCMYEPHRPYPSLCQYCFRVLVTVISASVDIGVRIAFQIMVLSVYVPRNGVAASYDNSMSSFVRNFQYCSP